MKTGIIIPVQASPKKRLRALLDDLFGTPLLIRTYENAQRAQEIDTVAVATDNDEVTSAITRIDGMVITTGRDHFNDVERCAATARILELDLVISIKADEAFIAPGDITALVGALVQKPLAEMATLRVPVRDRSELNDPEVVKVVSSADGLALYFSRAPIPFDNGRGAFRGGFRHISVYGYRVEFLMALAATMPYKLEEAENLEQLRALDMGARIMLVDAHRDYANARDKWRLQGQMHKVGTRGRAIKRAM